MVTENLQELQTIGFLSRIENQHILNELKRNKSNAKKIALVINTGGGNSEKKLSDAKALRRATLANKVPYCTNMSTAQVCVESIKSLKTREIKVTSLQEIKS